MEICRRLVVAHEPLFWTLLAQTEAGYCEIRGLRLSTRYLLLTLNYQHSSLTENSCRLLLTNSSPLFNDTSY